MYDLLYSTQVELSVRGLAVLPAALPSPDARLPWLPTPLLLALYVGHAAAAAAAAPGTAGSAPRAAALAGLADAATAAVRLTLTLTLTPTPTLTLTPTPTRCVRSPRSCLRSCPRARRCSSRLPTRRWPSAARRPRRQGVCVCVRERERERERERGPSRSSP